MPARAWRFDPSRSDQHPEGVPETTATTNRAASRSAAPPPARAYSYQMLVYTPGTSGDQLNQRSAAVVAATPEEARAETREVVGAVEGDVVLVLSAHELNPAEAKLWNAWHARAAPRPATAEA